MPVKRRSTQQPCPACKGSGKCPRCQGKGRITRPPELSVFKKDELAPQLRRSLAECPWSTDAELAVVLDLLPLQPGQIIGHVNHYESGTRTPIKQGKRKGYRGPTLDGTIDGELIPRIVGRGKDPVRYCNLDMLDDEEDVRNYYRKELTKTIAKLKRDAMTHVQLNGDLPGNFTELGDWFFGDYVLDAVMAFHDMDEAKVTKIVDLARRSAAEDVREELKEIEKRRAALTAVLSEAA